VHVSYVLKSNLLTVKYDELMQIMHKAVCYHANKKNIKLVLCAWVYK